MKLNNQDTFAQEAEMIHSSAQASYRLLQQRAKWVCPEHQEGNNTDPE